MSKNYYIQIVITKKNSARVKFMRSGALCNAHFRKPQMCGKQIPNLLIVLEVYVFKYPVDSKL